MTKTPELYLVIEYLKRDHDRCLVWVVAHVEYDDKDQWVDALCRTTDLVVTEVYLKAEASVAVQEFGLKAVRAELKRIVDEHIDRSL